MAYISRNDLEMLEVYHYNLVQVTLTVEFKMDYNTKDQRAIFEEIIRTGMFIDILKHVYEPLGESVVTYFKDPDDDEYCIYRFSSAQIASKALGYSYTEIADACRNRAYIDYYNFRWEEDYERDQNRTFDPNNNKFEVK